MTTQITTFNDFGLAPALVQAVADLGFEAPTPVQAKVIPPLLKGTRDLVALAQTGTGKTAAYGLPLLHLTDPALNVPQALILCPTRELCLQITRDLTSFAKHLRGIRILAVYGGSPIDTQLRALHRGVHIIVATPGRLNDVLRRKRADLSRVQRVVLDEADEMMSMGFEEDLAAILAGTPDTARTLLFSATMPRAVSAIASKYMDDPEEILVGRRNAGSDTVRHECYVVHARDRYAALRRILDCLPTIYGIVFCRTRIDTQEVAAQLVADGYSAEALHGDLTQIQRDRVMHAFRVRQRQLLVATDVASRGLDVTDLTHVINYNLPDDPDLYTHRSGRTGRAGKEGVSIVLANAREAYRLRALEAVVRKQFVHKNVPTAREVCEAQLQVVLDRVKGIQADEKRLAPYWSVIESSLESLTREDLMRRLVAKDFERFLADYEKAPDLNASTPEHRPPRREERGAGDRREHVGRGESERREPFKRVEGDRQERMGRREARAPRDRASEGPVTRLQVNVGHRNGLTPPALMTLINRATRGPMLRVGRVEIMDQTSVIEVGIEDTRDLVQMLNRQSFEGRTVQAMPLGQTGRSSSAPAYGAPKYGTPAHSAPKHSPPTHGAPKYAGPRPPRRVV
jgi:ATP-dependent RNA helicase DeaD